jgi:general secretion pathway protein F
VLLAAGLTLVEAIETLAQKEKRAEWRALLGSVLAVLRQGQPLSSALE